nr:hypothetical protein [uncultured bacterium]
MHAHGLIGIASFAALGCATAAAPSSALQDDPPAALLSAGDEAPAQSIAAARPPAVGCDDTSAPLDRRLEACTNECTAGRIESCEIHGDLQAGERAVEQSDSAGPALRTWASACKKKLASSCAKYDDLLKKLRERCTRDARTCEVLASTLTMLGAEEHRPEVDKAYERGCAAGEGMACFERGELHGSWEPRAEHGPISERAYERACAIGVQPACCKLASIYKEQGKTAKAAWAYNRGEAIKSSKYPRVACDIEVMPSASK